jgi:signal transduction histidine kinase
VGPTDRDAQGSPPSSGWTVQNGLTPVPNGPPGSPGGEPAVGQLPTRFWRSVRVRILLPVVLALTGLVVLGLIQVNTALTQAEEAGQTVTLAEADGAIGTLVHQIAAEYVLVDSADRPGADAARLTAQQGATDAAVAAFGAAGASIRSAAPELSAAVDAADRALAGLPLARSAAAQSPDGTAEVRAQYDGLLTTLIGLADALAPHLNDAHLVELSRSVALFAQLDRLAALQLDVIGRGLSSRQFGPGDQIDLAEWVGAEGAQVDALQHLQPGGDRYADLIRQDQVGNAAGIRQVVLDGRGAASALGTDPAVWAAAQGARVNGLFVAEQQLSADLGEQADGLGHAARERALLVGFLTLIVVLGTLFAATVTAVRISRQLRRTRAAALTAARFELPTAVRLVIAAHDAATVQSAMSTSHDRIDAMLTPGPDEIGELAAAFGAVHRQALRLAADQALLRMEVEAMFVALSRRGQTLVQRQIHLIDEFGRDEADPDALARLFALDHLAARMRRNEENLMVLAGGEPGRWITRPVAISDLIRAAAQEIEEYGRVQLSDTPAVAVVAHVAGDVIHLLAELLENATSFSPPQTRVTVGARQTMAGLAVTVVDAGIGMPADRLAEANERLARPSGLTSALVGTMGLLVVARLAQRHGVQVRLDATPAGGATASVVLPQKLTMPISAVQRLQPGRWLGPAHAGGSNTAPPTPAVTSLPPAMPATPVTPAPWTMPAPSEMPAPSAVPAAAANTWPVPAAAPMPARTVAPTGRATVPLQRAAEDSPLWTVPDPELPRRPADETVRTSKPRSPATDTPDPESVRARLSSLSNGIAAAQRGDGGPPSGSTDPG